MKGKMQRDVLSQGTPIPYLNQCAPPKHSTISNQKSDCGRMSLCILREKLWMRKASITIEAALILPFFIGVLLSFFALFLRYEQASELAFSLAGEAKQLAVIKGLAEEKTVDPKVFLIRAERMDSELKLPFTENRFHYETASCRAWVGFREGEEEPEEMMVYITPNGMVYHLWADCTHLKLSIQKVTLIKAQSIENQYGSKYRKCERCKQSMGVFVYITEEGDCYHATNSCSGLKRDVRCVPVSTVTDRGCCQRCKAREGEEYGE